ncbi:MAG TPA: hypothetical protein PKA06_05595 [Gemmatales bacterium]|nr:hypothetical protein [Gemmatales bacterium]
MPNWPLEFVQWHQNNAPLSTTLSNVVNAPDYGKDTHLRKELITALIPFYEARIAPVADFDTTWARKDSTKGMFASELIGKAITHDWLHQMSFARQTGLQQQQQIKVQQLAAVLLNNFKNAVAPVIAYMEKKSPAPQPRISYNDSTFSGMAADIVLTWDNNGIVGSASPGEVTPNGKDGKATQDAEMRWIDNYTQALLTSIAGHPANNFQNLRLELHVKARPCHYCGPKLNEWRSKNATIGAIPMFAFTYSDDQNNSGSKNVYRLDPLFQDGTKYLGKWA